MDDAWVDIGFNLKFQRRGFVDYARGRPVGVLGAMLRALGRPHIDIRNPTSTAEERWTMGILGRGFPTAAQVSSRSATPGKACSCSPGDVPN